MRNEVDENSRLERARGHEFRHQDDALVALHRGLPGVVEADDVGVLQALQHLHLLAETLPLRLGQLTGLQRVKTYGGYGGNLHAKEFIQLFYFMT